jgi:hypothetical protein
MRANTDIREINQDNLSQINRCDNSFLVEKKLRFYTKEEEILFGFKLGGFDRFLYQAVMPGTEEVAMYWYLRF